MSCNVTRPSESKSEALLLAEQMGERVRWVREAKGWTATELAAVIGVSEATVRRMEKGERGPSVPLIYTLSYRLGITPHYLFYGEVEGIDPGLKATLLETHPELRLRPIPPRFVGKRGMAASPPDRADPLLSLEDRW